MRQLAQFEEERPARTLADALLVEGIESRVDETREGGFVLWVVDEREMERAKELYALFVASPDDPRFDGAKRAASRVREEREKRESAKPKPVSMRARWATQRPGSIGPVTYGLIAACVGLALVMAFTDFEAIFRWLSYAEVHDVGGGMVGWEPFGGIRDGQLWRLVTPTFMHAPLTSGRLTGALHLFFNMWWLKDLGTAVERAHRGLYLIVFVLVVSVIANTAEYVISATPLFYGFSGVVLALYGYLWMRAKVDPAFPIVLPPSYGMWLIGWWILGLVGVVGGIANVVHTAGLVCGVAWGFIAGKARMSRRVRPK
jgi:GlpG protein